MAAEAVNSPELCLNHCLAALRLPICRNFTAATLDEGRRKCGGWWARSARDLLPSLLSREDAYMREDGQRTCEAGE